MSRPLASDAPRVVFVSTRLTPTEANWIAKRCATTGENRSEYLRRLVAQDKENH
jgi:hypothetical protein